MKPRDERGNRRNVILRLYIPHVYRWGLVFRDSVPIGLLDPPNVWLLEQANDSTAGARFPQDAKQRARFPWTIIKSGEDLSARLGLLSELDLLGGVTHVMDPAAGTRFAGEGADLFIKWFYEYFARLFRDGSPLIDSHNQFLHQLQPVLGQLRGTIADVGCGSGHYARWLADRGNDVIALDASTERLSTIDHPRIRCVHSSGASLPLPERSVDGAICIFVLEHVADHLSLAKEIVRIVKPGGLIVIAVPSFSSRETLGAFAKAVPPTLNFEHLRSFGVVEHTHPWCAPLSELMGFMQGCGATTDRVLAIDESGGIAGDVTIDGQAALPMGCQTVLVSRVVQ